MAGTDRQEQVRDEVGDDLEPPAVPVRDLDGDLDLDAGAEPPGRAGPRRWMLLPLLAAVVAVGWAFSILLPGRPPPSPPVGTKMPIGITITLPRGVTTDVDGQYVALHLDGVPAPEANLLLTTPTRVSNPSGELSPLPTDPARWLRGQPRIRVTRVDHLLVNARPAVQIDYRLAPAAGGSRFATVPLFCGTGPAENRYYPWAPLSCSRISADARVRATFVPVDGRTLLIEAYWSRAAAGGERIPARLQRSYADLLDHLTFVAR